jgi:uncharacterized membrane-anchored protein
MDKNLSSTMKRTLSKVPEITVIFWIAKILTTGMGEVFSDYLFFNQLDHQTAMVVALIGLAVSLTIQFSVKRYVPWIYWLAVVAVSIFGTMFADFIHDGLDLPFMESTSFFLVFQAAIFVIWYMTEKTLSITSIYTRRREAFYWATVLGTFALGTAAGDMTAFTMDLGTFSSGVLFAILIAIPALSYKLFGLNEIFAFWFAYIMTRPLGASFSDWMALPQSHSGLGWGSGMVSFGLTVIITVLVGYMTITKKEVKEEHVAIRSNEQAHC